jgi:hypothetical protein
VPFCLVDGCHCPSKMLVPIYQISRCHIREDSIFVKYSGLFNHLYVIYCCIVIIILFANKGKDSWAHCSFISRPVFVWSIRTIENL